MYLLQFNLKCYTSILFSTYILIPILLLGGFSHAQPVPESPSWVAVTPVFEVSGNTTLNIAANEQLYAALIDAQTGAKIQDINEQTVQVPAGRYQVLLESPRASTATISLTNPEAGSPTRPLVIAPQNLALRSNDFSTFSQLTPSPIYEEAGTTTIFEEMVQGQNASFDFENSANLEGMISAFQIGWQLRQFNQGNQPLINLLTPSDRFSELGFIPEEQPEMLAPGIYWVSGLANEPQVELSAVIYPEGLRGELLSNDAITQLSARELSEPNFTTLNPSELITLGFSKTQSQTLNTQMTYALLSAIDWQEEKGSEDFLSKSRLIGNNYLNGFDITLLPYQEGYLKEYAASLPTPLSLNIYVPSNEQGLESLVNKYAIAWEEATINTNLISYESYLSQDEVLDLVHSPNLGIWFDNHQYEDALVAFSSQPTIVVSQDDGPTVIQTAELTEFQFDALVEPVWNTSIAVGEASPVGFPLFDQDYTALTTNATRDPSGVLNWSGVFRELPNSLYSIDIDSDRSTLGQIYTQDNAYLLLGTSTGKQFSLGLGLSDLDEAEPEPFSQNSDQPLEATDDLSNLPDEPAIIEVLVLYSEGVNAFLQKELTDLIGSLDTSIALSPEEKEELENKLQASNLISLTINTSNEVLSNSSVPHQLRLVGSKVIDLTTNVEDTFTGLKSDESLRKQIAEAQQEYGADVVSIWVDYGSICGKAFVNPPDVLKAGTYHQSIAESRSWFVVSVQCALTQLSFLHELLHLAGAQHNRKELGQNALDFNENYGYIIEASCFRSVMGKIKGKSCARSPYLSNANLNLPEYGKIGFSAEENPAEAANNARVVNETLPIVARFFDSRLSVGLSTQDFDFPILEQEESPEKRSFFEHEDLTNNFALKFSSASPETILGRFRLDNPSICNGARSVDHVLGITDLRAVPLPLPGTAQLKFQQGFNPPLEYLSLIRLDLLTINPEDVKLNIYNAAGEMIPGERLTIEYLPKDDDCDTVELKRNSVTIKTHEEVKRITISSTEKAFFIDNVSIGFELDD
jgi:hypothetical protein